MTYRVGILADGVAGLSTGCLLRETGLAFDVIEADSEPGGWRPASAYRSSRVSRLHAHRRTRPSSVARSPRRQTSRATASWTSSGGRVS